MIKCEFEDGGKASLRHVTVDTIVVREGQVLLGLRGTFKGRKILESGKYSLLGGFFNRDEDLVTAAKREVLEESGWEIESLKLLQIKDNPDRPHEDRQNVSFVFVAEAKILVGRSDEEVTHLQWFDLDDLPSQDQIAFDHGESLELYRKYLKEPFDLPVLGKQKK